MKPWQTRHWVISELDANFLARMEMVLDIYERPYDPQNPVICIDEKPGQLLEEVNEPMRAKPDRPRRQDYEYRRCGTYNVFVAVEPRAGRRHVEVHERRTAIDFATFLGAVMEQYPAAEQVTVVLDNLSTHTLESLWQVFDPEVALRLSRRIQFVYTPVHGSWLNMAENELAAMTVQCLGDRRLADLETVRREVRHWAKQRNEQRQTIDWRFTVKDSRNKFERHYSQQFTSTRSAA